MQKRLDWPKEFYEGELKGATKADKMKAQVTKLLKRVKQPQKDFWPTQFYEGELKGAKRAERMKREQEMRIPTMKRKS